MVLTLVLSLSVVKMPGICQGLSPGAVSHQLVDKYALEVPAAEEKTLERLTAYLVKPYQSEQQKVRSLYAWMVGKLSYDHRLANSKNRKKVPPKTIIKTRKAICSGYADLFSAMCTLAGIESQVVIGYSRYYNFGSKHPFTWSDHAWNAVKLGGKWYLLDATWEGKRYGENGKQIESRQFLVDPGEFVVDHLPENPMWQLLACPVLLADFTQSAPMIRTILSRKDTCFSFSDSIAAWRGKLLPEQALSSARSAYQFNPLNHSSIGVALGRYGVYLAKNNAGNGKANINFRIGKEQEALHYFTQALQHLRKTRRDDYVHNRKKSINNCKKNIKASKARIKKLRKIKKTAINITLIDNRAASLGLTA